MNRMHVRQRREPVWVRVTREPVPGDWQAVLFALAVLLVIVAVSGLGVPS